MATKVKSEFPPSTRNADSEDDDPDFPDEDADDNIGEPVDNVSKILKQLQSSGALIKKPKQEYTCHTCNIDYPNWEELESHLIQHVSLPCVLLEKLESDEEMEHHTDDEAWSDDDEMLPPVTKTPTKIDVSSLINKPGLQIKQTQSPKSDAGSALSKLSGLGFTIKKNNTPVKEEKSDNEAKSPNVDIMKKLGNLGGLKLKLKYDDDNSNFKVVNGLRNFQTSDDEDYEIDKEEKNFEDEGDKTPENSDNEDEPLVNQKQQQQSVPAATIQNPSDSLPLPKLIPKTESPIANTTGQKPLVFLVVKRPNMKQTPTRAAKTVAIEKITELTEDATSKITEMNHPDSTTKVNNGKSQTSDTENVPNVVVKQEVEDVVPSQPNPNVPILSGEIKTERSSPPPANNIQPIPVITRVKSESDSSLNNTQPISDVPPTPLPPVTKSEIAVIEINGDSGDDDDDCWVVSSTPAPDVKPVIPKTENTSSFTATDTYPASSTSYLSSTPSFGSSDAYPRVATSPSTQKQHTFNWNAPDAKPPLSMLEKSADDIFENLLNSTKKEGLTSMSDSEYISLDRLGPQHTCDICNTRFTDVSLLEDHIRRTGHSKSIITPTSSHMMPYSPSSNILSSLLPVKHIADQVGKLSTIGGSAGAFTHQQNVMINIQAYPGASGMMPPQQQPYNNYGGAPGMQGMGQGMHGQYQQPSQNIYDQATVPGQYPGQYVGQANYGQPFQGQMPHGQNTYPGASSSSNPYATQQSPLQSMQQQYGQGPSVQTSQPMMMPQMGPVQFVPASTAGSMKPPMAPPSTSGVRIQNVQTFAPTQMMGASGQTISPGGQQNSPVPIRMGPPPPRPRMPGVRGMRPAMRPGMQVQGGPRGKISPRLPMKRPPNPAAGGPAQKRRPDMLLPGKHDNEDCHVMSMQKQRDGLPLIHSVQGAKDKLNLGSQISITKKTVNKEANAVANVLASRGISIKQKAKSRSPSPERPVPHIPNLGAGVSIKHTSKSSNFTIPEAKVGGGGAYNCKICKKPFMGQSSLSLHMMNAHPTFECGECPASFNRPLQLQQHKRTFHNVNGPNRELGIPVVDLSQDDTVHKLKQLGIYSFVPLANREHGDGRFGIPILSVSNALNGMSNSLKSLGAEGLLSLGPLKTLNNT